MRIFKSFADMRGEVLRDLVELGTEIKSYSVQNQIVKYADQYDMKEIIGYCYRLDRWDDLYTPPNFYPEDHNYIEAEMGDRLSPYLRNPGASWQIRKEVWDHMRNDDGKFDYTYNERFRTQYENILDELGRRPNTRQAVMTVYESRDQKGYGGKFRIPCSLTYQFLKRNLKLHLIYNMRSCDYFTHFKFDVALAIKLMEHTAAVIECDPGTLTHTIGSFHCFRKDWEKAGVF